MKELLVCIRKFIRDDEGASAIEYALIVALTAMAFYAGVSSFGKTLDTWYQNVAATVAGWMS